MTCTSIYYIKSCLVFKFLTDISPLFTVVAGKADDIDSAYIAKQKKLKLQYLLVLVYVCGRSLFQALGSCRRGKNEGETKAKSKSKSVKLTSFILIVIVIKGI